MLHGAPYLLEVAAECPLPENESSPDIVVNKFLSQAISQIYPQTASPVHDSSVGMIPTKHTNESHMMRALLEKMSWSLV